MKYAKIKTSSLNTTTLDVNIDKNYCSFDITSMDKNKDFWFDFDCLNVDIRLWFDDNYKPHLEIYPYNPIFVKERFNKECYSVVEAVPVWFDKDEISITQDHLSMFDATQLYCLVKIIDDDFFRRNLDIDAMINASYLSRFLEFFKEEVYWFLKSKVMSFQKLQIFCKEAQKRFPNEFIDFYDERFSLRN